ncbi:MAG: DnaD domain protein [Oscillospiraceae bacterium]|nr:DnaD domain protein [Oscillospiraceae bacterium]
MEYYLRFGQTFSVPVAVADHLLKIASHDQLKVLLYVLCHAETAVTAEEIVRACNVVPDAVEEALAFWQNVNVLRTDDSLPAVRLSDGTAQQPAEKAIPQPAPVQNASGAVQMNSSSFSLMPSEIAERVRQNAAVAEMFRTIQQYAGKPLNHTEQKSLIWMMEYLGLQPDLILMLAAFCVEQDCFQVRYMEQIAVEWQERGVLTHELVQKDIQRRTQAKSYTGQMMKLFEMQRRPTAKQQAYIDSWCADGMSVELVRIAYEKTREKKDDKLSFPYLDGILKRWKAAGVKTPEQAEAADAAFYHAKKEQSQKNAGVSAAESSIDKDELDQLMHMI